MDKSTYKLIQSHILDYLRYHNPSLKITKKGLFQCPFSHEHENKNNNTSCNIFPPNSYKLHCFDPSHGRLGDIFSVFRKMEPDMAHLDDDEIAEYLIHLLDIKTNEKIDNLLAKYHNWGWSLIPIANNSKIAVEKEWEKKEHKNIEEWKEWLSSGLNLGLNLGAISNTIAIDIDNPKTFEKIKHLLNGTLIQSTNRGYHYLYSYDKSFDGINHANLRSKGYEMEVRANNAYIVLEPSVVDNKERHFNDKEPLAMSEELKEFLLNLIEKPKENKSDKIKEAIEKNDLEIEKGLTGLDGQCNETFTKLGGILRKKMPIEHVEWALYNFNKLLADPMDNKSIKAMCYQLSKYDNFDKKELAEQILQHLKILESSTARDLKDSLKQEKKDIEEALDYLVKEGKIQKWGKLYKYVQRIDWETDFMSIGKTLDIDVPFFGQYANFENGSMIIIGGQSGQGKSHVACNLIKEFVNNEINPYYVCTEAGSRFRLISAQLGIKEGDYQFKVVADASTIELEDNAVTIIDWLRPKESNYAQMDTIMEKLNEQLVKHGGLLIIFVQIRKDGSFFASDLIDFYASVVAKYCHSTIKDSFGNTKIDNENTYFKTEKIRDSKTGCQYITIPTHFNKDTKKLTLRGDK